MSCGKEQHNTNFMWQYLLWEDYSLQSNRDISKAPWLFDTCKASFKYIAVTASSHPQPHFRKAHSVNPISFLYTVCPRLYKLHMFTCIRIARFEKNHVITIFYIFICSRMQFLGDMLSGWLIRSKKCLIAMATVAKSSPKLPSVLLILQYLKWL